MGDVNLAETLRDSTESLLSELCALGLEGRRLRLELESWPPPEAASVMPLAPDTWDDEESDRPTWIPDGEERRDTIRA